MSIRSLFRRFFIPATVEPRDAAPAVPERNADAGFSRGLRFASDDAADYPRAIESYLKAAEQNHAMAQFNLGVMYANGQGVGADERQARVWFARAAQQQDPGGEYFMGVSHYRASFGGTVQEACESRIEAHKWFSLAAAFGYRNSDVMRDTMALGMSREALAESVLRMDRFILSFAANPDAHAA